MTSESLEEIPAVVPAEAKRAGEVRKRWNWVEPTVWTERMLTALEEGVKGGKWYSLMDNVYARDHQRWPNAFFTEHGLLSLVTAHAQACQSSKR